MALYDADDVADMLQLLCLMEVVSFEDFEFAGVFSQLTARVFGRPQSPAWALPAGYGGKHLFLVRTGMAGGERGMEAQDIACIHPPAPLASSTCLARAAHLFEALAKPGLRTCLLYDTAEPAIGRDLLGMTGGEQAVEWRVSAPTGRRTSGLLFSRSWKSGVCERVVQVLQSYLQTLSPTARRGFSHHIQRYGHA